MIYGQFSNIHFSTRYVGNGSSLWLKQEIFDTHIEFFKNSNQTASFTKFTAERQFINWQWQSGPVYTKRQHQRCDNSAMTLAILFSLKSMESLENRLQPHSGVTPLFSMRTESQESSQSCCSVDADAWCKRALK